MTSQEQQDTVEVKRLARVARMTMVRRLRDKGYNNVYIGKLMGISENTVRRTLKDLRDR